MTERPLRRRAGTAFCLLALASLSFAAPQDEATKPDQVFTRNARSGAITPVAGVVQENGLEKVVMTVQGAPRDVKSEEVVRVIFGDVPPSYHDGRTYAERGDHASAAEQFLVAADDASARPVVQAAARLRAAEALMQSGATDPAAYEAAAKEAETFLADHPTNREVPAARMLQARASHLAGRAAEAAESYRRIFAEGESAAPTTGYSWSTCMQAGLRAAQAFLDAKDAARARETYTALDGALARVLGTLAENAPERAELLAIQSQARLGEGWCLLASGSASAAKTFFRGQISSAGADNTALLRGAELGLAETLLAEGDVAAAQVTFAKVSALDYVDRDRVARAILGLARCSKELPGDSAKSDARRWLQIVIDDYGDTPSVREARELLQSV